MVFAILRHPAYCLDNLAFYCNIERWRRLIGKEFKTHSTVTPSTLRSGQSKKRYDKRWFKVITGILIGISGTFMLLQMLGYKFDLYFYCVQGLVLQPAIVIGYAVIYKRLKVYHMNLINKYSKIFKPYEISELERTDYQVLKFFFLICQFLVIWSVYMTTQIAGRLAPGGITSAWATRLLDLTSIGLSFSSMLMMYGISVSIRRAL